MGKIVTYYHIGRIPGKYYQVLTSKEIKEREAAYRAWITEPIKFKSKAMADKVCAMSNKTRLN